MSMLNYINTDILTVSLNVARASPKIFAQQLCALTKFDSGVIHKIKT